MGLDADLPDAVRETGIDPVERRVVDLGAGVREAVTETAGAVEGTVGIVVPVARRAQVQGWLDSWSDLAGDAAGGALARIAVLTGVETKGLEFDGIVVVAPDEIEAESVTGRSTLYVVLTRATQRMVSVRPDRHCALDAEARVLTPHVPRRVVCTPRAATTRLGGSGRTDHALGGGETAGPHAWAEVESAP